MSNGETKELGGIIFTREEYLTIIRALDSHLERVGPDRGIDDRSEERERESVVIHDIQGIIAAHIHLRRGEVEAGCPWRPTCAVSSE